MKKGRFLGEKATIGSIGVIFPVDFTLQYVANSLTAGAGHAQADRAYRASGATLHRSADPLVL
jgi:hypothetical protein